jgi:hypothetical protein
MATSETPPGWVPDLGEVTVEVDGDPRKLRRALKRAAALIQDSGPGRGRRDDLRRLTDPATVKRKALGEFEEEAPGA